MKSYSSIVSKLTDLLFCIKSCQTCNLESDLHTERKVDRQRNREREKGEESLGEREHIILTLSQTSPAFNVSAVLDF